jgi:hypothetical protein
MTQIIQCSSCGKSMNSTENDMFAHVREHMDIQNLERRWDYQAKCEFPLQFTTQEKQ